MKIDQRALRELQDAFDTEQEGADEADEIAEALVTGSPSVYVCHHCGSLVVRAACRCGAVPHKLYNF